MRLIALVYLSILTSCGQKVPSPKGNNNERPNIILIMSDDMGYSDLGCYGGEIDTPNLDALANNGLRFTQFYNGARCCPTRASLISGCYPHQTGIGHMTNPHNSDEYDYGVPEYRGFLSKNNVTIAEVLKDAGYTTLMTGKWHLGDANKSQWPLQRGFDKYYGILEGASNYFKPKYPRGITFMNDTITEKAKDYYTTDAFTDYAIKFIDDSKQEDKEKPFFLYLAYTAPHWPIQAPQKIVEKYKGKYLEGWTKLRETRYARMKALGVIDENWELTSQDSRDWNSLSDEQKIEMDTRRAIYSAMVDRMDQNIGNLVNHLKTQNMFDNTLIIFLNDNGACAEFSELGSGNPNHLETKKAYNALSYGRAWANASNTPYKEYKHWTHEGGIGTPFIVHWPKMISKENQGKIISEYGFLPDIMASCVDVAQTNYPKAYEGNTIVPASGKSLVPLFKGENKQIHNEPIFWEHEGNKAVRLGKYKLVSKWEKEKETNWELYDMETDRTEMHNLANVRREKVDELRSMYDHWEKEKSVFAYSEVLKIRAEKKKNRNKNKK
ncbi:arylsulfatase [Algibacter amylolyticus]|uniref:arylsulfatase n=1 Tax=Algibacter amylolyticus TaxID=1608400 RepID=UPI0017F8FAE6|nr:arylsulfatase [Algibacter amylolyticus]MBB5268752.1 arylsulfatase [Algibacter amylolyticus]